jgi:Phosphoribosyl transferase/TRSP domain C terminus to PRTase_2
MIPHTLAPLEPTIDAPLSRGRMQLWVDASRVAPEDLLTFAERHNPKRAFLFVSKILGRHIPACPLAHTRAAQALAADVAARCAPGGVAVMGFAETAVGLGASVHEALCLDPTLDVLPYLPSTRHPGDAPVWFGFSESHSHATDHHVLVPGGEGVADKLRHATTLVVVDDEATTGATFAGLVTAAIAAGMAALEQVVLVSYTDWSQGQAERTIAQATDGRVAVASVALAQGRWHWEANAQLEPLPPAPLPPRALDVGEVVHGADGWRRGLTHNGPAWDVDRVLDATPIADANGTGVLAIGTGEFVWDATCFARAAAQQGLDARFLATTRSPILPGGAIATKVSFPDHYGLGIWMHLHNARARNWRQILLFVEREDTQGVAPALAAHLGTFAIVTPSRRVIPVLEGQLPT